MTEQIFGVTDIVGTSDQSIGDAIKYAVATASQTLRNLTWFEVSEIRGQIKNGQVSEYQVVMKVGFKYEKDQN